MHLCHVLIHILRIRHVLGRRCVVRYVLGLRYVIRRSVKRATDLFDPTAHHDITCFNFPETKIKTIAERRVFFLCRNWDTIFNFGHFGSEVEIKLFIYVEIKTIFECFFLVNSDRNPGDQV